MAWSIFDQGGGPGSAVTWADDELQMIHAPESPGNIQFLYDWEVSEGGGGKYNPLNQGPVPGDPSLSSTGPQYGGGAADYVSWQAGLQGTRDYLAMPDYQAIRQALQANEPVQARAALIASPWAKSHYGGGSGFSGEPVPGKGTRLPPDGGQVTSASGGPGLFSGLGWNPLGWPGQIASNAAQDVLSPLEGTLTEIAVLVPVLLGAAAIGVYGIIRATRGPRQRIEQDAAAAAAAGMAAL